MEMLFPGALFKSDVSEVTAKKSSESPETEEGVFAAALSSLLKLASGDDCEEEPRLEDIGKARVLSNLDVQGMIEPAAVESQESGAAKESWLQLEVIGKAKVLSDLDVQGMEEPAAVKSKESGAAKESWPRLFAPKPAAAEAEVQFFAATPAVDLGQAETAKNKALESVSRTEGTVLHYGKDSGRSEHRVPKEVEGSQSPPLKLGPTEEDGGFVREQTESAASLDEMLKAAKATKATQGQRSGQEDKHDWPAAAAERSLADPKRAASTNPLGSNHPSIGGPEGKEPALHEHISEFPGEPWERITSRKCFPEDQGSYDRSKQETVEGKPAPVFSKKPAAEPVRERGNSVHSRLEALRPGTSYELKEESRVYAQRREAGNTASQFRVTAAGALPENQLTKMESERHVPLPQRQTVENHARHLASSRPAFDGLRPDVHESDAEPRPEGPTRLEAEGLQTLTRQSGTQSERLTRPPLSAENHSGAQPPVAVMPESMEVHHSRTESPTALGGQLVDQGEANSVIEQLVRGMNIELTKTGGEVTIQLKPDSLGEVSVRVSIEQGVVSAQFAAENLQVKEIINAQLVQLRISLEEMGLDVGEFAVDVSTSDEQQSFADEGFQEGRDIQRPGTEDEIPYTQVSEKPTRFGVYRQLGLSTLDMQA